ncbi:MAG: FUSC family protein, partial [Firmicutes bacterium]|nr:FUSC family protein [Bacillota bacterium]
MKIGARIIKTGLAVTITMFICRTLHLEPALFGAVSAAINMQPSIYLTFKTAKNQITVHVLGVAIGLLFGYLFGGNPLSMGLTTILIIVLCMKLKLQNGILMGIVAAIFI